MGRQGGGKQGPVPRRKVADLRAELARSERRRAALERKLAKALASLDKESSFLNLLMERIPDSIYFKDLESRYIRVSRGMRLEGIVNLEDAVGKTAFDFYTQEHAQRALEDDQEIIRTGAPIIDKEDKETYANRPDAWVSTTKVPIFDKDGKVSGIVGISRDITERRAALEAVRKAKDDLEIRVQERTAALAQELERKARLAGELEVAQSIQRRFIPQSTLSIPRVNLKGVYHPAHEVGGDYLDYFRADSGHWVIIIADVSGKGIPAALVMTMLRSTFRAEAGYETSARKLLCAVNDLMIADLDDKSFVTALCLIIDKDGRSMSYARAGHPPLLLQQGDSGATPETVNPKGLALGLVGGKDFADRLEERTLPLRPGDRFLVFTDGLLEAMDVDRKVYGIERLLSLLSRDRARDPGGVLESILDEVRDFIRGEPYHDDLTMLAMEVTG